MPFTSRSFIHLSLLLLGLAQAAPQMASANAGLMEQCEAAQCKGMQGEGFQECRRRCQRAIYGEVPGAKTKATPVSPADQVQRVEIVGKRLQPTVQEVVVSGKKLTATQRTEVDACVKASCEHKEGEFRCLKECEVNGPGNASCKKNCAEKHHARCEKDCMDSVVLRAATYTGQGGKPDQKIGSEAEKNTGAAGSAEGGGSPILRRIPLSP